MLASDIMMPCHGAKYMLERGFKILPLVPNGKEPAIGNWPEVSKSIKEGYVDSTFDNRNWGVHPGLTGHFVVDIDNKDGKHGSQSWAELQRKHGTAPRTFTVRTPTGGLHLYFKGQGHNTIDKTSRGIDSKALRGYIVAPGSEIDEEKYVIIDDGPVADAPQWVIDLAQPKAAAVLDRPAVSELDVPSEVARAIEFLKSAAPAIQGQGGDARTYQVACSVRDFGVSKDTAFEIMADHWNPECTPPWSSDDLETKITNAYNHAQNSLGAKTAEAGLKAAQAEFSAVPLPPVPTSEPLKNTTDFDSRLEAAKFDASNPPPVTEPVLWIGDCGVAKAGDLVVIQAKVKSGKSSVVGAMMAAMLGAPGDGRDYLGFRGANPERLPIIHFDTEQSREDHFALIQRTLRRAGASSVPDNFHSYWLTAFSLQERVAGLLHLVEKLCRRYSGAAAIIFVDGVGDLCSSLNDEQKANELVDKLYALAMKYGCPLVAVLHENPGSEIGKTRGHLGSQLERKAASNLRLEKDGRTGVITLFSEKLRRGHLSKKDGPTFVWSKEKSMHVSCASVSELDKREADVAFDAEKTKCLAFFKTVLPMVGAVMTAKELNAKAIAAKCEFADANAIAKRFVDKVRARLANDESEIKAYREGGATGPWMFTRCALEPGDFCD
jgi:Bifunctional DNA primase/polymerase, N-terminal/AAA domain